MTTTARKVKRVAAKKTVHPPIKLDAEQRAELDALVKQATAIEEKIAPLVKEHDALQGGLAACKTGISALIKAAIRQAGGPKTGNVSVDFKTWEIRFDGKAPAKEGG